jgi:hypothetical protein
MSGIPLVCEQRDDITWWAGHFYAPFIQPDDFIAIFHSGETVGNGHPLLLAPGQAHSALADERIDLAANVG